MDRRGSGREDPRRWVALVLLSVAQLLAMSVWFTAGAVARDLTSLWHLSPAEAGSLVSGVQWGFVAGTFVAAVLGLADHLPGRLYFAASAGLAALSNGALLVAQGPVSGFLVRFLTGFFLAGVYPPAMKMMATWFRRGRGLAIGTLVGALTLGKAFPYLAGALEGVSMVQVLVGTSGAAGLAGILVLVGYREGPFAFHRPPFRLDQVRRVLGHRPTRLAIGGYLGHMVELYAMWAAMAPFLALRLGTAPAGSFWAFWAIAAGAPGCVLAGIWADRFGRERTAALAMVLSGSAALVAGWPWLPAPLLLPLVLFWGFWVVADSAQFSALVTEVGPRDLVGTALTLQTGMGFAITGVVVPLTLVAGEGLGWGPAFALLAVGPAAGVMAMNRLRRLRRAPGEP